MKTVVPVNDAITDRMVTKCCLKLLNSLLIGSLHRERSTLWAELSILSHQFQGETCRELGHYEWEGWDHPIIIIRWHSGVIRQIIQSSLEAALNWTKNYASSWMSVQVLANAKACRKSYSFQFLSFFQFNLVSENFKMRP